MRQPVTAPEKKAPTVKLASAKGDVVTVQMSDGTRWKVTRKRSTVPIVKKKGQLAPGVGWDASKVWLKVSWCQGTRGEIRVGGNPQGAAADLLKTLAQGIADGGDAPEPQDADHHGASITAVRRLGRPAPGRLEDHRRGHAHVRQGGAEDRRRQAQRQEGAVRGRRRGHGRPRRQVEHHAAGQVHARRQDEDRRPVPARRALLPVRVRVRARVGRGADRQEDADARRRRRSPRTASSTSSTRATRSTRQLTSKDDLKAVEDLKAAGYTVVNIQAFTSPEGLRDPSPRWKEGNKALSMRRAQEGPGAGGRRRAICGAPRTSSCSRSTSRTSTATKSEGQGKALEDNVIAPVGDGPGRGASRRPRRRRSAWRPRAGGTRRPRSSTSTCGARGSTSRRPSNASGSTRPRSRAIRSPRRATARPTCSTSRKTAWVSTGL